MKHIRSLISFNLTPKEIARFYSQIDLDNKRNIDAMPSGLLAKKYGIQQSHVCSILSRRIWRNI